MKSRSSSPQSSPQVIRRFRVDSGSGAAAAAAEAGAAAHPPALRKNSVRVQELPAITMNGLSPSPTNGNILPPAANLLSPMQHSLRRTSAEQLRSQTPPRDSSSSAAAPAAPTESPSASPRQNIASPSGPENSPAQWSSAVGHATTSGKSGRVIERLMSENDKLKRDLNAQVVKCQDLERSMQTYRPQIEALRQENDNLSHARGVDSSLMSRRERKIEELRSDLTSEKSRRESAEVLARQRQRERDDLEEHSRREIQTLTESTRHATLHAEILETSHRQLGAEYRARTDAFKKDLTQLTEGREQDRVSLARLDVVADQMRHELERSRKLNGDVVDAWERFQRESKARLDGMEKVSEAERERLDSLNNEMERTVGEMRWVMGLKRNMRNTDDGDTQR